MKKLQLTFVRYESNIHSQLFENKNHSIYWLTIRYWSFLQKIPYSFLVIICWSHDCAYFVILLQCWNALGKSSITDPSRVSFESMTILTCARWWLESPGPNLGLLYSKRKVRFCRGWKPCLGATWVTRPAMRLCSATLEISYFKTTSDNNNSSNYFFSSRFLYLTRTSVNYNGHDLLWTLIG